MNIDKLPIPLSLVSFQELTRDVAQLITPTLYADNAPPTCWRNTIQWITEYALHEGSLATLARFTLNFFEKLGATSLDFDTAISTTLTDERYKYTLCNNYPREKVEANDYRSDTFTPIFLDPSDQQQNDLFLHLDKAIAQKFRGQHQKRLQQCDGLRSPPTLLTGEGQEWCGMRVDNGNQVIQGQVNTTSELIALGDKEKETADLPNIYYMHSHNHSTITCGVIDTKKKADQFIAVIKALFAPDQPRPLRIAMHQLNGFGGEIGNEGKKIAGEADMIRNQHTLAAYIDMELRSHFKSDSPIVCHSNRSINGYTDPKITWLTGEEKKSHEMNYTALATQLLWLLEDLSMLRLPLINKTTTNIKRLRDTIEEREHILFLCQEKIKELESPLLDHAKLTAIQKQQSALKAKNEIDRNSLKTELQEITTVLKTHNRSDTETSPQAHSRRLHILLLLLSNQLELPPDKNFPLLSPAQEVAMQLLIDYITGAMTEINCKSGLDRTGFVRALHSALQQHFAGNDVNFYYLAAYRFIIDFHENVKEMDEQLLEAQKENPGLTLHQWLGLEKISIENQTQEDSLVTDIPNRGTIPDILNDIADDQFYFIDGTQSPPQPPVRASNMPPPYHPNIPDLLTKEKQDKYREILAFQTTIWAELQIGLKITEMSTGISGLKWHHANKTVTPLTAFFNPFDKNHHPLPYLPMYVKCGDDWHAIVSVKNGKRVMAEQGNILLGQQKAERRGN